MDSSENNFDKIDITSRLLNLILEMPIENQINLLKKIDKSGYDGARRHVRKYAQKPWVVIIDSESGGGSSKDFIKDISGGGMFIETRKSFSVGHDISLTFQLPSNRKRYKVVGEIIRSETTGIGVKFKRHELYEKSWMNGFKIPGNKNASAHGKPTLHTRLRTMLHL